MKKITWNWKAYFRNDILLKGMQDEKNGLVTDFDEDPKTGVVSGFVRDSFHVAFLPPRTYDECLNMTPWNRLTPGYTAYHRIEYPFYCNCSQGNLHYMCRHLAALLAHYEAVHGPLTFTLTAEEEQRIEQKKKWENERNYLMTHYVKVNSLLANVPDSDELYFHPADMTDDFVISKYEVEKMRAIEKGDDCFTVNGCVFDLTSDENPEITWEKFDIKNSYTGQELDAELWVGEERVTFVLTDDSIEKCGCKCGQTRCINQYYSREEFKYVFCSHALIAWKALSERIVRENPGDETDVVGDEFLKLLTKDLAVTEEHPKETSAVIKTSSIQIRPRIIQKSDEEKPQLGFLIGRKGERSYVVRDMDALVEAIKAGTNFSISKKTSFDFARESITEDSRVWFEEMVSNKSRNDSIRSRMGYYSYMYTSSSSISLDGGLLDSLYEHLEGKDITYVQDRVEYTIPVGEAHVGFDLVLTAEKRNGAVTAVSAYGHLPSFLKGISHAYVIDNTKFSKLSDAAIRELSPLSALADHDGNIEFTIGRRHLAEFYYRVLPQFQKSGLINVKDKAGKFIADLLPAEATFSFFLDILEDSVTCKVMVQYGEGEPFSMHLNAENAFADRDLLQEKRVDESVRTFFPDYDVENDLYKARADDTTLPWILLSGVDALSNFGEVKGTEAFRRVEVRPVPAPKVNVSLDSNLLDLSITSTEMGEDELLDLLKSYRLRKKWHRLKSGSFISLEGDTGALDDLVALTDSLGVSIDDAVKGKAEVPKYRAIYVDRLLEEHDQVAANRNRSFKSLIRSFRTIADSDYEVPEVVAEKLRPYQNYGYQWLRTLGATGFGGILADEMGLGKTLQMLSCIKGMREDGETKAFLVVCPASLVYNWKEEVEKFTPQLSKVLLAGKKSERREALNALKDGRGVDLYLTSYDTFKRDVTMYDGITFAGIVLDEAQFAKNQNTAVAKALKTLKADTRFALTGTPIENRLSELWNIFDFLMPGFLYTALEFRQKFELPIVKEKDGAAAERLSQMTKPFILRRRKSDVLKDLPEKLEETQAAQMDEEQRHLYDAEVVRIRHLLEDGSMKEDRFKVLAGITRLRQICCDPSLLFENYHGGSAKREACVDLIERSIDAGHKILLFSQFTSMLDLLKKDLDDRGISYYTITGSTPKKERVDLVDQFNAGDVPVFLISLRAGGTGLNLTSADVVIHYDPWWNIAVMNQATDRAHRIGQTKKVTVVKLIMSDTIEEKIIDLQNQKSDLADQILSGKSESLAAFSDEEVLKLLD